MFKTRFFVCQKPHNVSPSHPEFSTPPFLPRGLGGGGGGAVILYFLGVAYRAYRGPKVLEQKCRMIGDIFICINCFMGWPQCIKIYILTYLGDPGWYMQSDKGNMQKIYFGEGVVGDQTGPKFITILYQSFGIVTPHDR